LYRGADSDRDGERQPPAGRGARGRREIGDPLGRDGYPEAPSPALAEVGELAARGHERDREQTATPENPAPRARPALPSPPSSHPRAARRPTTPSPAPAPSRGKGNGRNGPASAGPAPARATPTEPKPPLPPAQTNATARPPNVSQLGMRSERTSCSTARNRKT